MVAHVRDHDVHTVVEALDVYAYQAIKIRFEGAVDGPDVRYPGVIHQDVDALATEQLFENIFYLRLIGYVANLNRGIATVAANSVLGDRCSRLVYIQNTNTRPVRRKFHGHRLANPAARPGDHSDLSVQPEISIDMLVVAQRETPRFQGMKSSCALSSALVWVSPLATFTK